ncbi:hypothetical protein ACFL2O_07655 [Thermodesulfobacteriota bacterium]
MEGALILAGEAPHEPRGRYCFQTTYVNECYHEYFEKKNGHKIIWVLRNPFSTIYSILDHWSRSGLFELFEAYGSPDLSGRDLKLHKLFGRHGLSHLKMACLAYNEKISQLFELVDNLPDGTIKVVEYDALVKRKNDVLPVIFKFIDLPYDNDCAELINRKSVEKKDRLSSRKRRIIEKMSAPIYKRAKKLVNIEESWNPLKTKSNRFEFIYPGLQEQISKY